MAGALSLKRVKDNAVLVAEGEPGRAAHVVITGTVKVVKRREDGHQTTLARLGEGELFGEMALVTQSPRVASVVADGTVDVFELPLSVLEELGPDAAALQAALSRQVCDRMVRNLMSLSPVFRVLPAERRGELMSRFQSKLMEPDEDIISEGQQGRGLFVILDGQVQVTLRKGGHKHVLNWLREGDIFGEISLVKQTPATATCTATRRTMVMFLPREDFNELTRDYPEVVAKITELGDFRVLDSIYTLA